MELAGGVEGLAEKWGKSREITWDEVVAYQPDYLMVMPCAFDLARTEREAREHLYSHPAWESLQAVRQGQVYLFDGANSQPARAADPGRAGGTGRGPAPGAVPRPGSAGGVHQGPTRVGQGLSIGNYIPSYPTHTVAN